MELICLYTIHGALFEHVRSPLLIYVRHRYQWTQHSAIVVLHSKPLMQQTKCPQCHSYTRKGKGGWGGEKGDLSEKGKRGGKGKGMRRRGGMKHLLRFTSSPYNLSYFQDFHFLVKADGTMVMRVLSRHQQIYLLSYFTKRILSISQILKLNFRIYIYQSN